MKKYCVDIMERDASGRLRLYSRDYFDENDAEDREDIRFAKKHGLEALIKRDKKEIDEDFEPGRYLVTLFREKRKRNGAIKSKKKLDGYEFEVK